MEVITEIPLNPGSLFAQIDKKGSGSVLFHYAVVKDRAGSRTSTGIRFERNGNTETELAEIARDIKGRWNIDDVLLVRRIGTLTVGDVISLVAVSSPASNDAFEACRFGLERLKKMVSLRKIEIFRD